MFPEFREMFMNITSRTYVHEQFTKYRELLAKVRELGGIFMQLTIRLPKKFANVRVHITSRMYVHEQFTKYHELFAKVHELGGNFFLQPTILPRVNNRDS